MVLLECCRKGEPAVQFKERLQQQASESSLCRSERHSLHKATNHHHHSVLMEGNLNGSKVYRLMGELEIEERGLIQNQFKGHLMIQ